MWSLRRRPAGRPAGARAMAVARPTESASITQPHAYVNSIGASAVVISKTSNSSDGPRPLGDPEHLAEAVDLCARGLEAEDVAYASTVLDSHARNFLRHNQAQAFSPRRGRVIKDLGCIVSLADELAGRLKDLDDMGRETL